MLALGGASAGRRVRATRRDRRASRGESDHAGGARAAECNAVASGSVARSADFDRRGHRREPAAWGGFVDQCSTFRQQVSSLSTRGASTKGLFFATGLAGRPARQCRATVALTRTGFTNTWTRWMRPARGGVSRSARSPFAGDHDARPTAATSGTVYSQTIAATSGATPCALSRAGAAGPVTGVGRHAVRDCAGTIAPTACPLPPPGCRIPNRSPSSTPGSATYGPRDGRPRRPTTRCTVAIAGTRPYLRARVGSLPPGLALAAAGCSAARRPRRKRRRPFPLPNGLVEHALCPAARVAIPP